MRESECLEAEQVRQRLGHEIFTRRSGFQLPHLNQEGAPKMRILKKRLENFDTFRPIVSVSEASKISVRLDGMQKMGGRQSLWPAASKTGWIIVDMMASYPHISELLAHIPLF
ncbi:hypothetical protein [Pseudomonas sp. BBP2017]|uniref:hypothetical protein n=1 Tax=Pseudomonas sp. BBP2017 TaxID=2109731 RepID=UPI000D120942|nr:hypothetical protein [Pseudomonas sp. BBP2017]PSS47904.1 hypothetical protein C6382_21190 [Pseudomonas sp. BBP2017]